MQNTSGACSYYRNDGDKYYIITVILKCLHGIIKGLMVGRRRFFSAVLAYSL